MKNIVIVLAVTLCLGFVCVFMGCKSIPSTEQMYQTSKAIGVSTGLVANMCKIDDTSRNVVIDIMNEVQTCVPETNETFEVAWTPIAKAHVSKLVEAGKIDAGQGEIIMSAFTVVVKGIDYLFEHRYPKARQYKELVCAATDGFCSGFLTVFKPANACACSCGTADIEAYEWLKANALK